MTPEGHALRHGSRSPRTATATTRSPRRRRSSGRATRSSSSRYLLGANRANDAFWKQTLANLATSLGVAEPVVETTKVCVDKRRQWKHAGNVRHSAAVHMAVGTVTAPVRWVRRRRVTS